MKELVELIIDAYQGNAPQRLLEVINNCHKTPHTHTHTHTDTESEEMETPLHIYYGIYDT